jgi:hypothetical protein
LLGHAATSASVSDAAHLKPYALFLQVHMRDEGFFVPWDPQADPVTIFRGSSPASNKEESTMAFFNSAITVLQTLVVALGAGLGIWGAINLLEGRTTSGGRRLCADRSGA